MRLSEMVREEAIIRPLHARDRFAAIAESIERLVATGMLPEASRDAAVAAVTERERLLSTGIGNGVAIPHAQLDGLERPLAAIGLSPDGVDFDAADGEPARIVIAVLTPAARPSIRIATLAAIARLFYRADLRFALLAAEEASEAVAVIERAEIDAAPAS